MEFAIIVGMVPCAAMLLASLLMMRMSIHEYTEAMLQNFSAGLVLAAVSGELFPLIATVKGFECILGTTLGFGSSLLLIYGVDYIIGSFENDYAEEVHTLDNISSYYQHEGEWEEEFVQNTSESISCPTYKNRILSLIKQMFESIVSMENRAKHLSRNDLTIQQTDDLAEDLDRDIHSLHYTLDKTRRLFQGSRSSLKADETTDALLAGEKRQMICCRLEELKNIVQHIMEHMASDSIDKEVLTEIHDHIDEADHRLSVFHESVQSGFSKWRRSRPFPSTPTGSRLPMAMIIPVCIDAIVDGLLIGIACSLSRSAGVILAMANCIEMSMLGMALSARVAKCTGSTLIIRYGFICAPPVLMLAGTALGAYLGDISKKIPIMFVSFVTFGIVALMFLACTELLIEASEIQKGKKKWWISITTFAAVYLVIVLDGFLP
eukprot:gene2225-4324_t